MGLIRALRDGLGGKKFCLEQINLLDYYGGGEANERVEEVAEEMSLPVNDILFPLLFLFSVNIEDYGPDESVEDDDIFSKKLRLFRKHANIEIKGPKDYAKVLSYLEFLRNNPRFLRNFLKKNFSKIIDEADLAESQAEDALGTLTKVCLWFHKNPLIRRLEEVEDTQEILVADRNWENLYSVPISSFLPSRDYGVFAVHTFFNKRTQMIDTVVVCCDELKIDSLKDVKKVKNIDLDKSIIFKLSLIRKGEIFALPIEAKHEARTLRMNVTASDDMFGKRYSGNLYDVLKDIGTNDIETFSEHPDGLHIDFSNVNNASLGITGMGLFCKMYDLEVQAKFSSIRFDTRDHDMFERTKVIFDTQKYDLPKLLSVEDPQDHFLFVPPSSGSDCAYVHENKLYITRSSGFRLLPFLGMGVNDSIVRAAIVPMNGLFRWLVQLWPRALNALPRQESCLINLIRRGFSNVEAYDLLTEESQLLSYIADTSYYVQNANRPISDYLRRIKITSEFSASYSHNFAFGDRVALAAGNITKQESKMRIININQQYDLESMFDSYSFGFKFFLFPTSLFAQASWLPGVGSLCRFSIKRDSGKKTAENIKVSLFTLDPRSIGGSSLCIRSSQTLYRTKQWYFALFGEIISTSGGSTLFDGDFESKILQINRPCVKEILINREMSRLMCGVGTLFAMHIHEGENTMFKYGFDLQATFLLDDCRDSRKNTSWLAKKTIDKVLLCLCSDFMFKLDPKGKHGILISINFPLLCAGLFFAAPSFDVRLI